MWIAWLGASEQALAEADEVLRVAHGEKGATALRPLLMWLRSLSAFGQLAVLHPVWSNRTTWSDAVDQWLPILSCTLYNSFVRPVRERAPCAGDDRFTKEQFGVPVRGCIDSWPVHATGPDAAYNRITK